MSEAARNLAHPDAARDIAAMAARLAGLEEEATAADLPGSNPDSNICRHFPVLSVNWYKFAGRLC